MFKKILFWLFAFAVSFMVQGFGLAEQGTAFMIIHLSVFALGIILSLIFDSGSGLQLIIVLTLQLVASWIFTKVFNIDYTVAYQIIAFGLSIGD